MTSQYQQPNINLEIDVPTSIVIQNITDLDAVAPADSSGARIITTPAGGSGIELQIRGHIHLPAGQYIVDDTAPGNQQGVVFSGRSAGLDGIFGNVDGGMIRCLNGATIGDITLRNDSPDGNCVTVGDRPIGLPEGFRFTLIKNMIIQGPCGGIRFFTPGAFPNGGITIGGLVTNTLNECEKYAVRFESGFTAGMRIENLVNSVSVPGLEIIQIATPPAPIFVGTIGITSCALLGTTNVPGEVKGIVFDDVSTISQGFSIRNCVFDQPVIADTIYDNATAAGVVPGVIPAQNLVSLSNVLYGLPPTLIAQNPV